MSATDAEDRAPSAREKILETAERLFALHGIDAVSIRRINAAAGQKNGSAVHYHFGSRDGLLEAIFALRIGVRDQRRLELLDALKEDARDRLPEVRGIADAMVRPMFEGLGLGAVTYHRRFCKQVHMRHELVDRLLARRHDLGLRECFRLLRWRRAEVPTPVIYHRYLHANALAVDAAANLEERIDLDPASLTEQRIALHVECCVDSIAAIFEAPVSGRAAGLLGDPETASPTLERWRARSVM
ncbi:helix-turn-helix domain containing protein [Albimonas sp. CAU 1670]|uniref:TetR/AcrR family transcriptional regulator n=1 Tax=Albimonas sp. CAU 1670 TaxID=3032599 RepID=UPI0023DA85C4|nr:TetR/AcrR family transcriptional regulator [Albimonas sp. CAU 1670]MDF2235125.1 helix-turn-helix domain containing protein [Albimonas sp. CAU 1670]